MKSSPLSLFRPSACPRRFDSFPFFLLSPRLLECNRNEAPWMIPFFFQNDMPEDFVRIKPRDNPNPLSPG